MPGSTLGALFYRRGLSPSRSNNSPNRVESCPVDPKKVTPRKPRIERHRSANFLRYLEHPRRRTSKPSPAVAISEMTAVTGSGTCENV
jgi:hypothetical protein